jgi:hypothetical protein
MGTAAAAGYSAGVAAAPDFKQLWDELVHTFHGHPAQQDLKDAYAAAISDAADAHQDLQEIVARHVQP